MPSTVKDFQTFCRLNHFAALRPPHAGPTVGRLKGDSDEVGNKYIWCGQVRRKLSQAEEVGRRMSEPLDSLIGGVLANQRGVWEGLNTVCTLVFYVFHSVISCFHVLEYWNETNCYYVRSGRINLCLFGNAWLHV